MMKRRPVLTTESAGHPLRRGLPPAQALPMASDDDKDWKLFLLSFGAFFTCFCTFIF